MKLKLLIIAISTVMLSSCSVLQNMTTKPVMSSSEPGLNTAWQGHSYAEIVRAFGAPTRTASDGAGGTIYVYEETKTKYTTSTSTVNVGNTIDSETTAETTREFSEFYVDGNDSCYLVRSNRVEPTGGRQFAPLKTLVYLTSTGVMLGIIGSLLGAI